VAFGADRHRAAQEEALIGEGRDVRKRIRAADARCRHAMLFDQMIDKVLAQDQDLFIIAPSVGTRRDAPPRNPSRASMRPVLNRTRHANAAADTALRSARVARFVATRNAAKPFPIPL